MRICLLGSAACSTELGSNHGGRSARCAPGSSAWCDPVPGALSSPPPPSLPRPPVLRRLFAPRSLCQPSSCCSAAAASGLRGTSRLLSCGSSPWRPPAAAAPPCAVVASPLPSSRLPSRQADADDFDLPARSSHVWSETARSSRVPSPCEPPPRLSFQGGTLSPRSPRGAASSSSSEGLASAALGVRRLPWSRLPVLSERIWSLSLCNAPGICCLAPSIAATRAMVWRMSECGEKKV
mmetsp:Transcript_96710/g.288829  ORF Transcript_96710/g.288829 Transcript_96710/m.288829 type:complete len:237 (-) Transcript_96710:1798-2508(-)